MYIKELFSHCRGGNFHMAIEGKSGSIYLVQLINCLSCANACAFNGNPDRYTDLPLQRS